MNKVIKTKCDNCEHEFFLSAVDINKTKVVLNDVVVDLVYFSCPKCDKIYRVSIQDARYYDLKRDLDETKKRMQKKRGSKNIEKAEVLHNMLLKKQDRLKAHVNRVNLMFPGTFVFEVSEKNPREKNIKYLP